MSDNLTPSELKHLETFFTTCLSDPGSMSHAELLEAIQDNQELCGKALRQLQDRKAPDAESGVTQSDITFLRSWLKAQNLVLGGMQLLQLADPDNAASIQHEIECTETAFTLLPGVLQEMEQKI